MVAEGAEKVYGAGFRGGGVDTGSYSDGAWGEGPFNAVVGGKVGYEDYW